MRRGLLSQLCSVLRDSITNNGCGLASVAKNIEEHYKNEKTRFTVLSNRFIGAQAIKMAKYGLRAVDALRCDGETEIQKFKRIAISKIFQTLRTIGTLINTTKTTQDVGSQIKDCCMVRAMHCS